MSETKRRKTINARITMKHGTEANWIKALPSDESQGFIPLQGELIVYDAETWDTDKEGTDRVEPIVYPRIKIGDGNTNVNSLPFLHGVGVETELHGEIFGDYANNSADLMGHAEGNHTKAGWRSHSEGYLTEAGLVEGTAHAQGRLCIASAKGSHASGIEWNTQFTDSSGKNNITILTTTPTPIDSNIVYYDREPVEGFNIGDAIYLVSGSGKTIKATDSKIITDVDTIAKKLTLHSMFKANNYSSSQYELDGNIIPDGVRILKVVRTVASEWGAHAMGAGVVASGRYSLATGCETVSSNIHSVSFGFKSKSSGNASLAGGQNAIASGNFSISLGNGTKAIGSSSISLGNGTKATGSSSIALGLNTTAYSAASFAEGADTQAGKNPDNPEISNNDTSCAHAEGSNTKAYAFASHTEGRGTIATIGAQHVQGKWNEVSYKDDGSIDAGNYAHIIGWGDSDENRRNIHTVDTNGNAWFAGTITCSDGTVATIDYVANSIVNFADGPNPWYEFSSLVHDANTNSVHGNTASCDSSATESFAFGFNSYSDGYSSIAMGYGVQATKDAAISLGFETQATGHSSVAVNRQTTASASRAFACGYMTNATQYNSFAEGEYTTASGDTQHVQGIYNIIDGLTNGNTVTRNKKGRYVHIVGNGTSSSARSNAHTLDWSGNAWFAGDVYIGGTSQDNGNRLSMIHSGTTEPDDSLGQDGDIYIKY